METNANSEVRFEVLCTTMNREIDSISDVFHNMRICSNVVFANQADKWSFHSFCIDNHTIKVYTTNSRGVGNNRNIALMHASAEICLLADDDIEYAPDYVETILNEFDKHPNADIIIFNIKTATPEYGRVPKWTKHYRRFHRWSRNPYGAPRIAFRLASLRKANVTFSSLFGGGALYPSGEDTIWIENMIKKKMKVYLSPKCIGSVSYNISTWYNEETIKLCYGKGALIEARDKPKMPYALYYAFITAKQTSISMKEAYNWIKKGRTGYRNLMTYSDFLERENDQ